MNAITAPAPSAAALKLPGFWQRAVKHRSFVIGGVLAALLLIAALVSFVWTPWSPYAMDMANKMQAPTGSHWLGTDAFGRDVASLLLVGARASILVGIIAVGIGLVVGTALGLLAAAKRGWVEEAVMRLSDFTLAFPSRPSRASRARRPMPSGRASTWPPRAPAARARSRSPCSTCCRTFRPC